MLTYINSLRTLLLGAWLGAAIFFSAVVAPAAFRVVRGFNLQNAGEIAGGIVSNALAVVNVSGFVVSLFSLLVAFAFRKNYGRIGFILQNVLLGIVAIACGIGEWVIATKMRGLRQAMRLPIDQISPNDPGRIVFQALHGYSVAALSIAIIAALIAFFVIARPRAIDR